jgi:hypothetical protein
VNGLSTIYLAMLGLLLIPAALFSLIMMIAIKKKKNLRLVVTLGLGFSLLLLTILFWASTREAWILIGGIFISVLQAAGIYRFWPR